MRTALALRTEGFLLVKLSLIPLGICPLNLGTLLWNYCGDLQETFECDIVITLLFKVVRLKRRMITLVPL